MSDEEGSTATLTWSFYSEEQLKALFWASYPSAILSVLGTCTTLYLVLGEWKESGTYNRIMLGLSLYELVFSLGVLIFKNWTIPKESGLAYGAIGNTTTCSINGFFCNLLVGSSFYTAFLAIYFVLKIRLEVNERTLTKYYEPICHIVPTTITLASGIYGVASGTFNPAWDMAGFCWYAPYPPKCGSHPEEVGECIRGEQYHLVTGPLLIGTFGFTQLALIISMLLIVVQVFLTERRLRAYGHGATARWKMTRASGTQALLYIGGYFVSTVGILITHLALGRDHDVQFHFYVCMVASILMPLSGFFNAIIFIRPRYRELTGPGGRLSLDRFSRSRSRTSTSQAATTTISNSEAVAPPPPTTATTAIQNPGQATAVPSVPVDDAKSFAEEASARSSET